MSSSPWRMALRRIWPWLAAASSGVLLAFSFAPWNFSALVWIALGPLICALWLSPLPPRRLGLRMAQLGYVAGLVFFSLVFYWLGALGVLFGQPLLKGLPILLALYMALYFAFWAWFLGRILAPTAEQRAFRNSWVNLATGALGASAWVAQEWVRGWLFSGFGWNGLGIALHENLPMIQIAALTGVSGLSWLIAFVNLMAVIIVRRLIGEIGPTFGKRIRWEFSISVTLVLGVFTYGVRSLMSKAPASLPLQVTALQPNIPQEVKFSANSEDEIFQQLSDLSKLALLTGPTDLLLWPESATPRGMNADALNHDFVMEHAALGDFGLLLGTVEDAPNEGATYNSAKLLTARGTREQTHRKMHLVPFGEYLPMRPVLEPIAGSLVPGDFTAGREATVFELGKPNLKFSPLICFEDTLGELTRHFVGNGAQCLINLTNDGWFLKTAGAQQHLHNAIFRAVENRRPLIRCTNTGVTCSVGRDGRVGHLLRPFQTGFQHWSVEVPVEGELTFYTRHGDWLAQGSFLITALALIGFPFIRRPRA